MGVRRSEGRGVGGAGGRKADAQGFAVGDAVIVLDVRAWCLRRGQIISPIRQGAYMVRLLDGVERYAYPGVDLRPDTGHIEMPLF